MTQSRQSRGDDDEDMHETETEGIKNEESIRYGSPPPSPPQPQPQAQGTTATSSFHSILNSPSAADILQPLSTVAAQRSFPLPTSGSLASLARRHQHDHADGRRISEDSEPTSPTNSSSLTHERLLQSDSVMDATTRPDLSNLDDVGARSAAAAAVRDFTAVVWDTSSRTMTTTPTTETKPIQGVSAYSSSPPFSSPTSSLAEGSSDPLEEEDDQQRHIFASPFASIFPEGTNTITPLIIRRYDDNNNDDDDDDHDDSNNNDDAADADHRTIFKYSESIQLFRRRPEDGGKTWKRRVLEYR